jgi:hypothetical protein
MKTILAAAAFVSLPAAALFLAAAAPTPAAAANGPEICFYTGKQFSGAKRCSRRTGDLNIVAENRERYVSVTVSRGFKVTIFSGLGQTGESCEFLNDEAVMGPGCASMARSVRIEKLFEGESAKQARNNKRDEPEGYPDNGLGGNPKTVCFYENGDYTGSKKCYRGFGVIRSLPGALDKSFNAVEVAGGAKVTIFEDRNLGGVHTTLFCGGSSLQGFWRNQISSWRTERSDRDCGKRLD